MFIMSFVSYSHSLLLRPSHRLLVLPTLLSICAHTNGYAVITKMHPSLPRNLQIPQSQILYKRLDKVKAYLWLLELTFLGRRTFLTAPYALKSSRISPSVVSKAKFFTISLFDFSSSLLGSTTASSDFYYSYRFSTIFYFLASCSTFLVVLRPPAASDNLSAWSSSRKF